MTKETDIQLKRDKITIAQPFNLCNEIDLGEANIVFDKLLEEIIDCSQNDRLLIKHWFACHILRDFVVTKPILFFAGTENINKNIGQQLLYLLFFGTSKNKMINHFHKTGVNILFYNDMELYNSKAKSFLLDATNHKYLINAVVNDLPSSELAEKSFFLTSFNKKHAKKKTRIFKELENRILIDRDTILSAILNWSSEVITMLVDGKQKQVRTLIDNKWSNIHPQRAEYLSLMYMMNVVMHFGNNKNLKEISPNFVKMIEEVI